MKYQHTKWQNQKRWKEPGVEEHVAPTKLSALLVEVGTGTTTQENRFALSSLGALHQAPAPLLHLQGGPWSAQMGKYQLH